MKNLYSRIKSNTRKGFTIIEVMIVLAIAGVIMSIVFLAVPQLQRSSRNSQRDADANKVLTAVNDCLSNNNGAISSCITANESITVPTYGSTPVLSQANGYIDLSKIRIFTTISVYTTTTASPAANNTTAAIYGGNTCNGNGAVAGATNQFVVLYKKEAGSNSLDACVSP